MIEPTNTRLGLEDRLAIVTAGTHGIGLAIATKLCDSGAHVVVACAPDDPDAERARLVLADRPGSATIVHADVRDADAVHSLLENVVRTRGRIDVFVHHAVSPDLTPMLNAVQHLAKAFVDGGRIVVAGYTVTPVHGVIRTLALEMAWHGVAVNAVLTSLVDHGAMNTDPDLVRRMGIRSPAGRVTVPSDVANAVALMCTAEAAWIQGQIITVDGGMELLDKWGETR